MTEADLDLRFTHLCRTMTYLGERNAALFLARFALLAMGRLAEAKAPAGVDRCSGGRLAGS
jgi:hypothetical protein